MEQQSLLTDLGFNPVFASPGKRFLNYLIDTIVIYVFVFVIFFMLASAGYLYVNDQNSNWPIQIAVFGLYLVYFSLSEILFSGRTVGKFITGTKAVNEDGTQPEPKTFFFRALSRMVPFESFSALGNPSHPWHDKWTKTYVIDVKKTALNEVETFLYS